MKKKSLLMGLVAVGVVASLAVGGTLAYFTDNEQTTRSYTVGDIAIDLVVKLPKEVLDGYTANLVPNQKMAGATYVVNTGTNPSYAFIEVDVPAAIAPYALQDGTPYTGEPLPIDLFVLGTSGVSGVNSTDFTLISSYDVDINGTETVVNANKAYTRYVYAYNTVLVKNATSPDLFDTIIFANIIEGGLEGTAWENTKVEIPVRTFAIQSTYLPGEVGTSGYTLGDVYDIVINQNRTAIMAGTLNDADFHGMFDSLGN